MIYELKEELIMILKNHIITDIAINKLEDLHKLKPFWEDGTLKINKSQIARELKVTDELLTNTLKAIKRLPTEIVTTALHLTMTLLMNYFLIEINRFFITKKHYGSIL